MDDLLYQLITTLECSIRKNGDKPLTVSHLLNILKKIERNANSEDNCASECDVEH